MSGEKGPTRSERRAAAREERLAAERAAEEKSRRRKRVFLLAGVALLAAAAVVIAIVVSGAGEKKIAPGTPPADANVVNSQFDGISQQGVTLGAANAPVTMVYFADLKCPVCKDFETTLLPQLIDRYVRPGKVKIELRNQQFVGESFNPGDSPAAARAGAAAAQQNRLWQFSDLWFHNQRDESERYANDQFIRFVAGGVAGLDVPRLLTDRTNPQSKQLLAEAKTLFDQAQRQFPSAISGTPAFLLKSGKGTFQPIRYTSFQLSQFATSIDQLLSKKT